MKALDANDKCGHELTVCQNNDTDNMLKCTILFPDSTRNLRHYGNSGIGQWYLKNCNVFDHEILKRSHLLHLGHRS